MKERKLAVTELLNPKWIIEPGIWKDETHEGSNYKIKLKLFLDSEELDDYVNDEGETLAERLRKVGGYKGLIKIKSDRLMPMLNEYSSDAAEDKKAEDTRGKISLNDWLALDTVKLKDEAGTVDLKKFYTLLAGHDAIIEVIKNEYAPEAKLLTKLFDGVLVPKELTTERSDNRILVDAISAWLKKHRATAGDSAAYTLKNLFADLRKTNSADWKAYLEKCCSSGALSNSDKKYAIGRIADVFTDREDLRKLLSGVKITKDATDMKAEVAKKVF